MLFERKEEEEESKKPTSESVREAKWPKGSHADVHQPVSRVLHSRSPGFHPGLTWVQHYTLCPSLVGVPD